MNYWNVPGCASGAVVSVPGLTDVVIGSYIWNPLYGYFEITDFDPVAQHLTVQNNCQDGNQPVGTQVPGCTKFIVIDPPGDTSGGNTPLLFPYVALDFVAPADGDCIDIAVTTVNGLAVGKNVQIGSGTYRLESIPSSTLIRICNDGAGITPGTNVIAQNGAGQYQYPIVLIDTNPCTHEGAEEGILIGCVDGVAKPMTGAAVGSVWVLVDAETGRGRYELLDVPTRTCTAITCCLTLTPGVSSYTIPVGDSSQFTNGDTVQIGTREDRGTITAIPDATHITITLVPTPGSVVDIPPGTSLCIIDCCEDLQEQIDALSEQLSDQRLSNYSDQADEGSTGDPINQLISSGGTTSYTQLVGTGTGVITNTSAIHNMIITASYLVRIYGVIKGSGDEGSIEFVARILRNFNGGGLIASEVGKRFGFPNPGADIAHDEQVMWVETLVLAPGETMELGLQAKVNLDSGTPEYNIQVLSSLMAITAIVNDF